MGKKLTTQAIPIALFAIAAGTCIDAIIKAVGNEAGLDNLLAWRFFFGAVIAVFIFKLQKRQFPDRRACLIHTLRGVVQVAAAFLFFYAVLNLSLAEATIIGFTAALMVPPIAWILLGETIRPMAILAAVIGFCGAAIAVSGTPAAEHLATGDARVIALAACFLAAFLYALMLVLLRMRATKDDATTIAVFTNLVPAICTLPILISPFITLLAPNAPAVNSAMDWNNLPLFLGLGLAGYSIWFLMTLAYAQAPAQILAPLDYSALIWSALFGYAFFKETPAWTLWIGAVLIVISCLLIMADDRRSSAQPLPEA